MTDLFWDEVLLTNNPDSKELEVSFKKIDGDGFLTSAGEEPGTPGGIVSDDGGDSPPVDDEGDFIPTVPPIDGGGDPQSGGPIPPESAPDECGGYDCNAFVDSVLSLDSNLSWHMWPTQLEAQRAITRGPAIEDDFGNILSDVYYYNNARGDITTNAHRFDTPSTSISPNGEDIRVRPLGTTSQLKPCGVWAREGRVPGFAIDHDIGKYASDGIANAFENPSAGANRNFSFSVELDFNWYWEFGEDSPAFNPANVTPTENLYIAPSFTPTLWKALGGPSERTAVATAKPAFKLYPYGGKVRVGSGGNADSTFTELRPAVGTDLFPVSGWYKMKYTAAVIVTPGGNAGSSGSTYTVHTQLFCPMGIFEHEVSGTTSFQNVSPIIVRDWGLAGAAGVSVYAMPSPYPDDGLVICSSPTTVDTITKTVIERLRQGYTAPDYCNRIP